MTLPSGVGAHAASNVASHTNMIHLDADSFLDKRYFVDDIPIMGSMIGPMISRDDFSLPICSGAP
jgi:hypothetical protein